MHEKWRTGVIRNMHMTQPPHLSASDIIESQKHGSHPMITWGKNQWRRMINWDQEEDISSIHGL